MHSSVGVTKPGKAVSVLLILIWILSLAVLLVAATTYVYQLYQMHIVASPSSAITAAPADPISPVTDASAIGTFAIITYATRKNGLKAALMSALVGTMAAPMIFELPFDLIVVGRPASPVPPNPTLYSLLVLLPLIALEVSTFSLLTLSPLMTVSKYTMFCLAGVFFVFALWASVGFPYPSDPMSIALNAISKVLSFIAAITLFIKIDHSE